MENTSSRLRVRGLELCVHRFRDAGVAPNGTTLLLLHGFLDCGASWDLVAEPLARAGFDVIAPDLRGFGGSEGIGAGGYYHFPDYIADVSELVLQLAPARLGVVGHSMGGTIASLFAGAEPESVWRLALCEGVGVLATEPGYAVDRMRAWLRDLRAFDAEPRRLASLDDAVRRLAASHPRVPRDVLASRARLLTRVEPDGRIAWAYDPLHRTTSPVPFHAAAFTAFLAQIACPTLFVSGGAAGMHPPDEAERLAAIRSVRSVELPEAGHMMHWSAPGALARELIAFFTA